MDNQIHPAVIALVQSIADELSDAELASIHLAAAGCLEPRDALGYEKAQDLFTADHGTRMHADTFAVLESIVEQRLST